jgi:L-2-hydroxyglutarate oxidase
VRNLIYPVPDPSFPFLGVHFTRSIEGMVEAGPNAVLGLAREGYKKTDFDLGDFVEELSYPGLWRLAKKNWRVGVGEIHRSFSKKAFVRGLKRLVPEVEEEDLVPISAGVRAQAISKDGALVDDFLIAEGRNSR